MDLFRDDATAFVELEGLGISSFCKKDGFFEEAFLRDKSHTFSIKIESPRKGSPDKFDLVFEKKDIKELKDVSISIETLGETETKGWGRYEPDTFDRNGGKNDPHDLRWMLGLGKELHGNDLVKNLATRPQDKRPLSYVHVHNAYFFAKNTPGSATGQKPYFVRVRNGIVQPFGPLAESYGARIKASKGIKFVLKIGSNEVEVPPLPHLVGRPYKILISNVDKGPTAPATDLLEMMKYISDPFGKQVDLIPLIVKMDEVPKKLRYLFVSPPNYCHPGECSELCTHGLVP